MLILCLETPWFPKKNLPLILHTYQAVSSCLHDIMTRKVNFHCKKIGVQHADNVSLESYLNCLWRKGDSDKLHALAFQRKLVGLDVEDFR